MASTSTGSIPQVSVVVATHNRSRQLGQLLESLRAQTVDPAEFEVLVVDDGSSDDTPSVLARERDRGDLALGAIRHEHPAGPSAARNAGWRAARGPVIAFTDDDCAADPAWLEVGRSTWLEHSNALVQGPVEPKPDDLHLLGPFSRTIRVDEAGPYFQACNMFYPRALLEQLGGFDVESFAAWGGEDADLAWRAIKAGAPVVFASGARVFHAVNHLGPIGKLQLAARWSPAMQLFARHPEIRAYLDYRIFWKGSHYLLVRALLARAFPRYLRPWLVYPYLGYLIERGRIDGGGPLIAPYYVLHDLVELITVLRGAVRYRTLVL